MQVPLGVLDKNENKNEDMKSILAHLEQYVPVQSDSDIVSDPATDMEMEVFIDRFHYYPHVGVSSEGIAVVLCVSVCVCPAFRFWLLLLSLRVLERLQTF